MNNFGIATGTIYKFVDKRDLDEILSILKPFYDEFKLDSLEITCGKKDSFNPKISEKNVSFIGTLSNVSIHFPFDMDVTRDYDEEVLLKVKELYEAIGAEYVVIHARQIKKPDVLMELAEKHEINFVTELEDISKDEAVPIESVKTLIEEFNMDVVFDTGHAEFYEDKIIKEFLRNYSSEVCGVHLNKVHDGKAHNKFHKFGGSFSLELSKNLNCAKLIEETFEKGDVEGLREEIEFLLKTYKER